MVDSFLFGKLPPGPRRTLRRSAPAYHEYQITPAGKRQEKIEGEGSRGQRWMKRKAKIG
jgi:hypothetical protein